MTVYQRPGVFIEETLTPLAESASGVPGEAVAAFIGAYHRGPIVATKVTSWAQYTRLYGGLNQAGPGNNYLSYAVYEYFLNGGTGCYVSRVENSDSAISVLNLDDLTSPSPEEILEVKATSPGVWGDSVYVAIAGSVSSDRFDLVVYKDGTSDGNIVEKFVDLSVNPADPRYVVSLVNSPLAGSSYVRVRNLKDDGVWVYTSGTDNPATVSATALDGGDDGSTPGDIAALGTVRLDAVEGILNVNLPGISSAVVVNEVIAWAEGRGDVFVVADGPAPPSGAQTSAQVAQTYINLATGGGAFTSSSYVAVYGPWIQVQDPASSVPGATKWLPPGGAVLGKYASNDVFDGVQKAPAGISNSLKGVVSLETRFSSTDLDALNNAGINAIKIVPGAGFCVFGARTLAKGYPSRYVSIRRTLMQLRHDFIALTRFAIFEPNNAELWAQISATLSNYLTTQMQQGVLQGSTQDEAFHITCDATNNPGTLANSGIVNVEVAVALSSPAEFLVIKLSQFQGGSTTSDGV